MAPKLIAETPQTKHKNVRDAFIATRALLILITAAWCSRTPHHACVVPTYESQWATTLRYRCTHTEKKHTFIVLLCGDAEMYTKVWVGTLSNQASVENSFFDKNRQVSFLAGYLLSEIIIIYLFCMLVVPTPSEKETFPICLWCVIKFTPHKLIPFIQKSFYCSAQVSNTFSKNLDLFCR